MTSYSYDTATSTSFSYDDLSDVLKLGSPIGLLLTLTYAENLFTNYAYDSGPSTTYSYDNAN